MAKKKETKKTKKEKEEESAFDWKTTLDKMIIPDMLKAGFTYYIETNDITVKSENDLETLLTKFKQMNAGV